jgi:hypothetical protein
VELLSLRSVRASSAVSSERNPRQVRLLREPACIYPKFANGVRVVHGGLRAVHGCPLVSRRRRAEVAGSGSDVDLAIDRVTTSSQPQMWGSSVLGEELIELLTGFLEYLGSPFDARFVTGHGDLLGRQE